MRNHWFKVTACALIATILISPTVNASDLNNSALAGKDLSTPKVDAASKTDAKSGSTSQKYPFKNFKAWIKQCKAVNPDVAGWLTVPGTNINEPVVHTTKNNIHYVKRDWRGTNYPDLVYSNWYKKPTTASYIDYRVKFGTDWKKGTSRNIVIYGHNWNNLKDPMVIGNGKKGPDGNDLTMFAQLPSYTNLEFSKANPYIYFSTEDYEGIWKVFSVAYCELSPKFPYNIPNSTKEGYLNLVKEWKERSLHNFNVEVDDTDRILTLSTCTRQYNVGEYQRYVVVARLLRDGEKETDKVNVVANPNWKRPKFG